MRKYKKSNLVCIKLRGIKSLRFSLRYNAVLVLRECGLTVLALSETKC
jgi:hypothetical protein